MSDTPRIEPEQKNPVRLRQGRFLALVFSPVAVTVCAMRCFHALFLLLLGVSAICSAEERTEESFIPNYAVAGAYYSWGGDSDFEGAPGSFSNREFGVDGNVPVLMRGGFRLTAGARYRSNTLEFSGAPAPFGTRDLDLERLDLPINAWIDLNRDWKLWARLQPGWHSDFETVNSDDFILSTLALLSYRWSETTKIAFGAYHSRDLGEERLLPALGFIFEPSPQLSVALTFPRAEVVYAPTPDRLLSSRIILSGAGWNITDPAGGPSDVDLNYQAIRAGFGFDQRISGPVWFYVDGGLQFGQEIEIVGGLAPVTLDVDSSPYLTTGVKIRF